MFPAVLPPPSPPPASVAQTPRTPAAAFGESSPQTVDSHGYHYIVVDNRLLTEADVRTALESAGSPRAALGALKQAYESKGFFLVALVGTEKDKNVTIRVIQGRLTHVEGSKHLAAFFVGLEDDDTLRRSDVVRSSILAQAYAATNGKQPQISFHPAPEVGGSTMQVGESDLQGSHRFGANVSFGNFGNRYAGHYIAQGSLSLQGQGMTLQVSQAHALPGMATDTHGAFYRNDQAKFSAITPVGILGLDASKTQYHLGEAFAPLYPAGRIEVFGATATQLVYADETRRWSFSEGAHRIHDANTVFSGLYSLYDRRFNLFDLGSDFSWRFGGLFKRPAALNLSVGAKLGSAQADWGFTRAKGAPASHFKIYTASAGLTQSLAHGFSMKLDISGQATPYTLPSYEQWVLGGLNNLAAWMPGTIVGDRGYLGRFTVQAPEWRAGPFHITPSVFAEHGAARYSYIAPQAPVWQSLTDAGAGLSLDVPAWHTSATLAWAKPMDSHDVTASTRRGQRSHLFFYLKAGF